MGLGYSWLFYRKKAIVEYATLGKTDIKVSRVCIGGMSFGKVFPDFHQWVIDQPATQAVLNAPSSSA